MVSTASPPQTQLMNGADILVQALIDHGVEVPVRLSRWCLHAAASGANPV